MKTWLVILLLSLIVYHSPGQQIKYNFSASQHDYRGKIKCVTSYVQEFNVIDSSKIDSTLSRKGKLRSTAMYDEKGLLTNSESYNDRGEHRITRYFYNKDGNVISIKYEEASAGLLKEQTFVYNHAQRTVIKTSHPPYRLSTGRQGHFVFNERLTFDEQSRNTQIEYLDSNGVAFKTTRLYYDDQSHLRQIEHVEGLDLKDSGLLLYDSLGRKLMTRQFDKNGEQRSYSTYNWENNFTETQKMFDKDGSLIIHLKEISIKDKYGNCIKKYFYEVKANSYMITENIIEYWE